LGLKELHVIPCGSKWSHCTLMGWAGTAKETEDYSGKVCLPDLQVYVSKPSQYLISFARVGAPRKDSQDNKIGGLWN
jgi:hypothetical protein